MIGRIFRKNHRSFTALAIFLGFPFSTVASGLDRSFSFGFDARSLGLSASSTLNDWTPSASSRNPAALTSLSRAQVTFFHAPLFEGIRYDAFTASRTTLDDGSFAFVYAQVTTPDIEVRSESNFLLQTFQAKEQEVSFTYARKIFKNVSAGLQFHWFRQKLFQSTEDAVGADAGFFYTAPAFPWTFSLAARNLWDSGISTVQGEEKPKPVLTAGSARSFGKGALRSSLHAELEWITDDTLRLRAGWEGIWKNTAALRVGWNGFDPTLGAGLIFLNDWQLDWAAAFQQPLGVTHRFSLALRWGKDYVKLARELADREARLKAEILEKLRKDSTQNFLKEGYRLLESGLFDEAEQEFAKVLAWDAQHVEALQAIEKVKTTRVKLEVHKKLKEGELLEKDGDLLNALVAYHRVLELFPQHAEAKQRVAELKKQLEAQSRLAFQESAALPPETARRYFREGLDLYASGRYSEALQKWKAIVAADPIQRQIFDFVSRAQVKLEAEKTAIEAKKEKEVRESRIELLQRQAIENARKGDLPGAIAKWKEVLQLDPQNTTAKRELQKAEEQLKESKKRGLKW